MYPEEGKKIGRVKSEDDDMDCAFFYTSLTATTPLPPPRHKPDSGKTSNFNLIEF